MKRDALEAAELVAFDVFNPALRSRGGILAQAREMDENESLREKMHSLFSAKPTGRLIIPTLADIIERIGDLERRMAALEKGLKSELVIKKAN